MTKRGEVDTTTFGTSETSLVCSPLSNNSYGFNKSYGGKIAQKILRDMEVKSFKTKVRYFTKLCTSKALGIAFTRHGFFMSCRNHLSRVMEAIIDMVNFWAIN